MASPNKEEIDIWVPGMKPPGDEQPTTPAVTLSPITITCQSRANRMPVTCQPHANRIPITYQSNHDIHAEFKVYNARFDILDTLAKAPAIVESSGVLCDRHVIGM